MQHTTGWFAAAGALLIATAVAPPSSAQPNKGDDRPGGPGHRATVEGAAKGQAELPKARGPGQGGPGHAAPPGVLGGQPRGQAEQAGKPGPGEGMKPRREGSEPKGRPEASGAQTRDEAQAQRGDRRAHAGRDRKHRRHARIQALRERWGEQALVKPPVKSALKVHSWRMARLQRIRALAEKKGDAKLILKVDGLIEKEQGRFGKHMEKLKASGSVSDAAAPVGTGDSPVAPAVSAKGGPAALEKEKAPKGPIEPKKEKQEQQNKAAAPKPAPVPDPNQEKAQ